MARDAPNKSRTAALEALEGYLSEFGITLPPGAVSFVGSTPPPEQTHSEVLNLSLVGAVPPVANAAVAAQIFEARGGAAQVVEADLRRGHNYIDPDVGMTPSLNGQEITLDLVAGNPFTTNIFETRDGQYVVLSAVYVHLAYQWSAFLGCTMAESDVRRAVKQWDASGKLSPSPRSPHAIFPRGPKGPAANTEILPRPGSRG